MIKASDATLKHCMSDEGEGGAREKGRAQSTVIGVVLILGIVIAGATLILTLAGGSITDTQARIQVANAEQAMTQLDSEMSLVAHGAPEHQSVTFPKMPSGTVRANPSAGSMRVRIENASGTVVVDTTVTLGAIVYDHGSTTVAYQGGGAWRATSNGSVMISPPEFDYTVRSSGAPTLTLPLVTIDGGSTVATGDVSISQAGSTTVLFPTGSAENPLENGVVNVTVTSDYYHAWGRYFEERTEGDVTYDHAAQQVTIQLVIPRSLPAPAGLVSGAGTVTLQNTGTLDSYDSGEGPYASSQDDEAVVMIDGNVKTQNAATIKGTVQATGKAEVQNSIDVFGPFVVGSAPTKTEVTNGPVFRDLFSVQGDAKIDVSNPNEFRDDVIVGGNLTQMKQAEINGDLYVGGDATIRENNVIHGDVIVGGDVTVDKNTQIDGSIEAGGNVTLKQGATPSGAIIASGSVTLNQNADAGGDVHAGGEIELGQKAEISGDARAGPDDGDTDSESIETDASGGNAPRIRGDAFAEDSIDPDITVDGTEAPNTAVADPAPATPATPRSPDVSLPDDVNDLITDKDSLETDANNDNDEVAAIDESTDSLSGCSSTCTIDAGEYHLEAPTVGSGDTLKLNTSGGDITIYVDGEFAVDGGAVEVVGDGRVDIYLDDTFKIQGTGSVTVPDDRSPRLWAFMRPSGQVTFQNQATFQGVVYGPPSSSQDGVDVTIQNQAEIFGAVVGHVQQTSNNNEIHYDETLAESTRETGSTRPQTTFLHISTTEIKLKA